MIGHARSGHWRRVLDGEFDSPPSPPTAWFSRSFFFARRPRDHARDDEQDEDDRERPEEQDGASDERLVVLEALERRQRGDLGGHATARRGFRGRPDARPADAQRPTPEHERGDDAGGGGNDASPAPPDEERRRPPPRARSRSGAAWRLARGGHPEPAASRHGRADRPRRRARSGRRRRRAFRSRGRSPPAAHPRCGRSARGTTLTGTTRSARTRRWRRRGRPGRSRAAPGPCPRHSSRFDRLGRRACQSIGGIPQWPEPGRGHATG
jgi:hypothetical protein